VSAPKAPTRSPRRLSARVLLESTDARRAAALCAFALLLRIGFVLVVERRPAFPSGSFVSAAMAQQLAASGLFSDAFFYHHTAELLASGHGFASNAGVPTAQWPPLFPLLLSLVYRITGPEPLAGELMNALLGGLTVPLLYVLALRTFGRLEATIAAGFLAVFPGQILWPDVLLSETLYTLLLVSFFVLVALLPRRPWSVAVLGVAVGLATLTRGEAVLLVPAVMAVWWHDLPRARLLVWTAALVAVAGLTVAPWTIRNAIAMDAFVPLSTNASITLWSGHNPDANGAQVYAPRSLLREVQGRGKEREIGESELLRRKAFEFMGSHPGRELELIPLKLLNLNRGDSWALEWVNAGRPGSRPIGADLTTPVRVIADSAYFGLLAATILALILLGRGLWQQRVVRGVLVLFAGALVTYGFVYYGNYRYRASLEPLMMLVSAPLLARLWRLRGDRL
jgi:4-amino-4-deoxy-L-arabinose transferase-like glycosyltransferase